MIDELKATQEQLVRGETLQALGVLAAGVTHHLNNLLAVTLGRIQFLLRKVEEPGFRSSLEVAERAALDAAEVVRQVRGFSQAQPVVEVVPVDLNQLAQEVLELTSSPTPRPASGWSRVAVSCFARRRGSSGLPGQVGRPN